MADQFKEYHGDESPIMANITKSLRQCSLGLRELVIGACVIVLVLMVIALGTFVGVERERAESASSQLQQANGVCMEKFCLESAAWAVANMNQSVSPCDNFYQYACGSYPTLNPLNANRPSRSILNDLYVKNQERLRNLLETAPRRRADWAAEKKLKDLFVSCIDDFQREKLRGTPILKRVLPLIGGWSVIGTWNASYWDFNDALKRVQSDLWVDAFWRYYTTYDRDGKYALLLYPAGTGKYMRWSYYIDPTQTKVQEDYKRFMRRVAYLLLRDNNTTLTDEARISRVERFVYDAFSMEQKIARFATDSPWVGNYRDDENRISLAELTRMTGHVIDYVQQVTYILNDGGITKDTKVILPKPSYFRNLSAMINNLPASSRNRMLHNYLVWRALEKYVQELSWEYVHANREVYVDLTGRLEFLGIWRYCFYYVQREMPEALGALFVQNHFADQNKAKVTDITTYLKQTLEDTISKSPWMDGPTKAIALEKAKAVTYKLGYPDNLVNEQKVDEIYTSLTINRSDWMQNILQTNAFKKTYYNRLLKFGEDRNDWYFNTFDTNMAVLWYWNEIIVPAGLLQFPFYDYHLPHYTTFGSMGTTMGHFILHIVDEYGRRWDKNGVYLKNKEWWSNQTKANYASVKQCVINFWSNKTQGPFMSSSAQPATFMINAEAYSPEAIAITGGVRLAYQAYQAWQKKMGQDKSAPGLGLTNDQVFFLSYAQSQCSNRNDRSKYYRAYFGRPLAENRTNMVLQELPEFAAAFGCGAGKPMNPPKKCQFY